MHVSLLCHPLPVILIHHLSQELSRVIQLTCHMTQLHNMLHNTCAQGRLKEMAQDMLGPERWLPQLAASHPWRPAVLGHDKRQLLRELLVPVAAAAKLPIATAVSGPL